MIKIEYSLDNDSEIELTCLLGDLVVSDGEKSFTEECIYIDSWFCTFVEGLILLKRGSNSVIDLLDEPYGVSFLIEGDEIEVSIPGRKIALLPVQGKVGDALDIFERELKRKILLFLKEIDVYKRDAGIPTLTFLNDFVEGKIIPDSEFVQPVEKEWPGRLKY